MSDRNHAALARVEHGDVPARMHPLVAAAMATGNTLEPSTLRELLAVQREWEAGEARKAFSRALVALKRDLPTVIARDKVVDFSSAKGRTYYTHTSLAAVMDAITDPLTAHGFSLSWTPGIGEREVRVTCKLTHAEGHREEATLSAPADTSGNKNHAQAVASTVTLLSRYTALALLGIATADMEEPRGEVPVVPTVERVDADRNLRAVAEISKRGRSRQEAEALVGRPVSAWTAPDLERLRAWLREPPVPAPAAPPAPHERQPGEEG